MIAPDAAAELRAERRFDMLAAALIGTIAVLAAILAMIQLDANQTANRANMQAARLAADLSARISVSEQSFDSALGLQQGALRLGLDGTARQIAGLQPGDASAAAVGAAERAAYDKLARLLSDTSATSAGKPLDAYTVSLLRSTTDQLKAELTQQNDQVDLASAAGLHEQRAVLGLSFLALAGVLTGLAAVLREGRGGLISLSAAAAMAAAAGAFAVLALV